MNAIDNVLNHLEDVQDELVAENHRVKELETKFGEFITRLTDLEAEGKGMFQSYETLLNKAYDNNETLRKRIVELEDMMQEKDSRLQIYADFISALRV